MRSRTPPPRQTQRPNIYDAIPTSETGYNAESTPIPSRKSACSCIPLSNATITILNRIAFCMHFVMCIVAIVGRYVHVSEFALP
jgi:hypothetical protein